MIRKIKQWFLDRFLPMWAKETVLAENKQLKLEAEKLRQENRELRTYINGLESGFRYQRRIVINTGEVKK